MSGVVGEGADYARGFSRPIYTPPSRREENTRRSQSTSHLGALSPSLSHSLSKPKHKRRTLTKHLVEPSLVSEHGAWLASSPRRARSDPASTITVNKSGRRRKAIFLWPWNPNKLQKMAQSQTVNIALMLAFFGTLAFIFGVVAENKKPPMGTIIHGKGGVIICRYPNDPTVAYGVLSIVTLLITAAVGLLSVFYPYKGKKVPTDALFSSTTLMVFFSIAVGVTVLAEGMMMWATITEGLHRTRNVHYNPDAECATAKTGLFGGAAFLALDAALFWLICQMLTMNARADYLEEDDDPKGDYGQVLATEYDVNGALRAVA